MKIENSIINPQISHKKYSSPTLSLKENKYKILRMSILLNQNEVDKITLDKFREASLNIDKMLSEDYDKKMEDMFYDTLTLEE